MADVLKLVKPQSEAEQTTQTALDTIIVTPDLVKAWKLPPFQRALRVNDKVRAVAAVIMRDNGVIPGVITLGVLNKERYLIDGQHRREAFLMSGCMEGFVDIRVAHYNTMAEMADEYVNLNSRLVTMRPDDILRGLESSAPSLGKLRRRCPYVGYDMIRRNDKSPIISMSALLRCWFSSAPDVPANRGIASSKIVDNFTEDEADGLIAFLETAMAAWGRDAEYAKLWNALNLTIVMWLYRRLVITPYSAKTPKLTKDQFTKCLMGLSTDDGYLSWLVGRQLRERDRSPCYSRVKAILAKRLELETGKKALLPAPSWVGGSR